MKIAIGHPAYSGANAFALFANQHRGCMELIKRGADRQKARAVIREIVNGSLALHTLRSRGEIIEVSGRIS